MKYRLYIKPTIKKKYNSNKTDFVIKKIINNKNMLTLHK